MKREGVVLLGAVLFGAGCCLLVGIVVHGDPLLVVELLTMAIGALWATRLTVNLWHASRLAHELGRFGRREVVHGTDVRVIRGGGMIALVTGVVRPTIYLGDELMTALDDDERRAIVLHESHHRSIHAPVRAAAIDAWIAIAGRAAAIRRPLIERLVDLETLADAHALAHGSSAGALASALLKTEPAMMGVAASRYGTARRVHALLGDEPADRSHLAYEWLPIAVAVIAASACHVLGLAFA